MVKLKCVFILAVLIGLSSCAAKKRAAEFEAQPEWIRQKPNVPGYFIGIGSAKKIGLPAAYIEKSKQDALADLAAGVSVQISSTSVLHTIETEYGKTDLFDQHIEIVTDDYLQGFEPVDSYENEESYWVYYRINKNVYYEAKAKRKKEAIGNAKAKYIAGQAAQQNLNPKEAISFYLQGLSAIKQYLAEETTVDYNGNTIDVGNELFTSLNQVILLLEITPVKFMFMITRGNAFEHPMQFMVLYHHDPVKGVPVTFKYSGGYLKNNDGITDDKGLVSVDLGTVQSKRVKEQLYATVDYKNIAQKATDDLFIRGLITNRKVVEATIEINISNPTTTLVIDPDFCNTYNCSEIIRLFEKDALNIGYLFDTTNQVDYMFRLNLNYSDGESSGNLTSVYLAGNIKAFNAKKELIWSKDIVSIKGVGHSKADAKKEAFEAMFKNLNLIYFRQGLAAIN